MVCVAVSVSRKAYFWVFQMHCALKNIWKIWDPAVTVATFGEALDWRGSSGGSAIKNQPASSGDAGDVGSIPGWGRNWQHTPVYFHLDRNLMDGKSSRLPSMGVAKIRP